MEAPAAAEAPRWGAQEQRWGGGGGGGGEAQRAPWEAGVPPAEEELAGLSPTERRERQAAGNGWERQWEEGGTER